MGAQACNWWCLVVESSPPPLFRQECKIWGSDQQRQGGSGCWSEVAFQVGHQIPKLTKRDGTWGPSWQGPQLPPRAIILNLTHSIPPSNHLSPPHPRSSSTTAFLPLYILSPYSFHTSPTPSIHTTPTPHDTTPTDPLCGGASQPRLADHRKATYIQIPDSRHTAESVAANDRSPPFTMAAPGTVDPSKAGKYPIFLSDELLGKTSKETYTGIRCEHPSLQSP